MEKLSFDLFTSIPIIKNLIEYQVFGISALNIALAIFVFFFFMFLRSLFTRIILSSLNRLVKQTVSDVDDKILGILKPPIKFSFIILGLYASKGILGIAKFEIFLNNLISSLIIFVVFWIVYRAVDQFSYIFRTFFSKFGTELSSDIQNFLIKTLKVIIVILGAMTFFEEWGFNVSAFVASLGLGGLAFALAAKDTAANFFGSMVIFTDRPFQIGDWVEAGDTEGVVEDIGIRSTKIRTFSKALVSVPNATVANSSIVNWSRMNKRRIKMRLGLTCNTTTEQMEKIVSDIKNMLQNDSGIDKDVIMIYFDEFGDSSLSIFCYFFTITTDWAEFLEVREKINLKIMKIIEENGSGFAFPSQSLYIEKMTKE